LDWFILDQVILGATKTGQDSRNLARMAVPLAELPETIPALTVNRLCSSGLWTLLLGKTFASH